MGKSSSTSTSTATTNTAPFGVSSFLDQLINFSTNIRPYDAFAGGPRRIAGFTPDQERSFQMVRDALGRFNPLVDQSVGAVSEAISRSGRAPTQGELEGLMNPFTETVLNRTRERMQEDLDRNLKGISGMAAKTGSFGGSRQALLEGTTMSNTNRNIGDMFAGGMERNFNQAVARWQDQINNLVNTSQAGMNAAQEGQRYLLTDAAALEQIGLTQQGLNQSFFDADREDRMMRMEDEWRRLGALHQTAGVFPYSVLPSTNVTTQVQRANPITQAIGAASAIGSFFGGGGGSDEQALPFISGNANRAAQGVLGNVSPQLQAGVAGRSIWGAPVGSIGALLSTLGRSNPSFLPTTSNPFINRGYKAGGRVKKTKGYAYGGRVGNPFSMGDSSEVIQKTQNPFNPVLMGMPYGPSGPGYKQNLDPTTPAIDETGFEMPRMGGGASTNPTAIYDYTPPSTTDNPFIASPDVQTLLSQVRDSRQNFMGNATLEFKSGGFITPKVGDKVKSSAKAGDPRALFPDLYDMATGQRLPTNYKEGELFTDPGPAPTPETILSFDNPIVQALATTREPTAPVRKKRRNPLGESLVPLSPGVVKSAPTSMTKEQVAAVASSNNPLVQNKIMAQATNPQVADEEEEKETLFGLPVHNMDLLKFGLSLLAGNDIGTAGLGVLAEKEATKAAQRKAEMELEQEQRKAAVQMALLSMRGDQAKELALFKDEISDENRSESLSNSITLAQVNDSLQRRREAERDAREEARGSKVYKGAQTTANWNVGYDKAVKAGDSRRLQSLMNEALIMAQAAYEAGDIDTYNIWTEKAGLAEQTGMDIPMAGIESELQNLMSGWANE